MSELVRAVDPVARRQAQDTVITRARGYISALEQVIEDLKILERGYVIEPETERVLLALDEVRARVEQDLRQAQQTLDVMLSMDQETSTATETETK